MSLVVVVTRGEEEGQRLKQKTNTIRYFFLFFYFAIYDFTEPAYIV